MRTILLFSGVAAVAMAITASSAAACTYPYKRVTIDGNRVCALDVSASNNLKARTKGQPASRAILKQ